MHLFYPHVLSIIEKEKLGGEAEMFYKPMQQAQRYIFESFGDVDEATVKAIHSTAEEMISAGFYHLPHKVCWIEDPWDFDTIAGVTAEKLGVSVKDFAATHPYFRTYVERSRAIHLAVEEPGRILIYGATINPQQPKPGSPLGVVFHGVPLEIDISPTRKPLDWTKTFATMAHALNQFIVTLATKQAVLERVPAQPWKPKQPISTRVYGHTHVTVRVAGGAGRAGEAHGRPRYHLVAGYTWGRHTRPAEQQRWIMPYWRGDEELGAVMRDHYEVKA